MPNGNVSDEKLSTLNPQPSTLPRRKPLRASANHPVTQLWYARQGIITPEMEFIAIRENGHTVAAGGDPGAAPDGSGHKGREPAERIRPHPGAQNPGGTVAGKIQPQHKPRLELARPADGIARIPR